MLKNNYQSINNLPLNPKSKMKKLFIMFALIMGVVSTQAQSNPGNDLYKGLTEKIPYGRMIIPYGIEVTFGKTVHIIFPSHVL